MEVLHILGFTKKGEKNHDSNLLKGKSLTTLQKTNME